MPKNDMIYYLTLLIGTLIASVSQVLLKKSAQKEYKSAIREYLNPLVVIAYIMFAGSMVLSVIAYKKVPLSLGPLLEATGYIYVTIFGIWFFGEKINIKKLIALILIICGIIISSIII